MEIYQLRTFLAIARTGHLTRAAEQLHLTQSAVSKQIKSLEAELGVLLFARNSGGMTLSKAGQLLLPQAEKTLHAAVELLSMSKQLCGTVTGTVRLGTIIDPEYIRLGALLGQLLLDYPKIDVKLSHGISGWVLEQIRNGKVDAGFYLGKVTALEIETVELAMLTYRVVAPAAWAEQIRAADWAEIARMPWIGTPVQSSQHRLVKEMFGERGFELTTVAEADQESSMRSLTAMGLGLCLLRDDMALAAQASGEVTIWDKASCPCPLSLVFLQEREQDVLIGAVKRSVNDVWGIAR